MKRIVQTVSINIRVVLFMFGLVMCMGETISLTTQICVSLAGMALMIITVLPTILREWRSVCRMN